MRLDGEVRAAMREWLASRNPDTLATVTLKQALPNDDGGLTPITDADCDRTCWLLRDRVTKAVLGNRRWRAGETFPFEPFVEGGDGVTRRHIHVLLRRPADVGLAEIERAFVMVVARLHWTRPELDVRAVCRGTSDRAAGYCLKEGLDAFCPAGASL